MPKFEKHCVFISFLFFSFSIQLFHVLYALDVGFAIDSEMIFLEKTDNPYYPQVIPSFDASFFFKHSFVFNYGSFDIMAFFFFAYVYSKSKQ